MSEGAWPCLPRDLASVLAGHHLQGNSDVAGTFKQQELGNILAVSGKPFDFQLKYTPSTGYEYGFALGTLDNKTLTFRGTDNTLQGVRAIDFFNAISIRTRAEATNSSVVLTSLNFTVIDSFDPAIACGSLVPNVTVSTPGAAQTSVQWLVSDKDLSRTSWTITGTVVATRQSGGGSETVRLQIATAEVSKTDAESLTSNCTSACPAL